MPSDNVTPPGRGSARKKARPSKNWTSRAKATLAFKQLKFDCVDPEDSARLLEDRLGIVAALKGEASDLCLARSYMQETYGGGSLEQVPEFDAYAAITAGIAQPGTLPDVEKLLAGLSTTSSSKFAAESVIGPSDTRRPVPNSAVLPWRCIALLQIRYASGQTGRGTAWAIGPRTYLTAAHCVHHWQGGPAREISVLPAYRGGATPYGVQRAVDSYYNPNWPRGWEPALDFAMIFTATSAGVGWFGYSAPSDDGLKRVLVNLAGYPDDHPGNQYFDGGRITDIDSEFIYHTIDTEEGQSGSPLFWSNRDQRIGLGIHTYGVNSSSRTNVARRITPDLFSLFQEHVR